MLYFIQIRESSPCSSTPSPLSNATGLTTAKSGEHDSAVIDLAGSINGDDDTIKTVDSI